MMSRARWLLVATIVILASVGSIEMAGPAPAYVYDGLNAVTTHAAASPAEDTVDRGFHVLTRQVGAPKRVYDASLNPADTPARVDAYRFAPQGARALVDAGKYDYLFGNVSSNAHNAARSAQNAQQLARIGVHDNAVGRALLRAHFDDVVRSSDNILRTFTNQHGTFQVRESLFAAPGGFLKFESTWQVTRDGLRLSTVVPFGGP